MNSLEAVFLEPKFDHAPSQQKAEEQPSHEVHLTTNPYLDELCLTVQSAKPDWEYIQQELTRQGSLDNHYNRQGLAAEIHLDQILRKEASSEFFRNKLRIDPIKPNAQTYNIRFQAGGYGNLVAANINTGDPLIEYDAITRVDKLPVVWEVKTILNKNGTGKQNKRGMQHSLHEQRIYDVTKPIKEYFAAEKVGYVVVTVPENISSESPTQNVFKSKGGIIVPLAAHYDEFKENSKPVKTQTVFDLHTHKQQKHTYARTR